jgi:CBS domain-containing protein
MYTSIMVGQVLRQKGRGSHSIAPDALAYDALELMADKNIGALMVLENGHLIGVFSERDYARKVILKGRTSKSTTVRELMSSQPICVTPGMYLRDCMVLMTQNHIRHLPVLDNGVLLGVVSNRDVVETIISDQAEVITTLENYIAGVEYVA